METKNTTIESILSKVTNNSDIISTDFKSIENSGKENMDFSKVRGNIRLMSGKIKTPKDVAQMVKSFLSLRLP